MYPKKIQNIIKKQGYTADQVFSISTKLNFDRKKCPVKSLYRKKKKLQLDLKYLKIV